MVFYDRPQPDLLPRGEGIAIARFLVLRKVVRQIQSREFSENQRMILPLLEERAGVRTDV